MTRIFLAILTNLLVGGLAWVSFDTDASELNLHVAPAERLMTEPAHVAVAGAPPGSEVWIEGTFTDNGGQVWSSRGIYFANHIGFVDTSSSASLAGTYQGVDAEALFWSMLPVPLDELDGASVVNRHEDWPSFPDFDSWNATYELRRDPVVVNFRAELRGALAGTAPAATASQSVSFIADGVKRIPVSEGDIRGVLYEAPDGGPNPVAMIVTGSGGGVYEGKAALLASHGITALALAHFNYPGRPRMLLSIPLEYFSESMKWLADRYGRDRVVILGASRGGEGVLLIASAFPDQVSAVIAEVPANMVFAGCCTEDLGSGPGWTLNGKPLPYVDWQYSGLTKSGIWAPSHQSREVFRKGITDHDYDDPRWIPVERIQSPILMITGDADGLWAADIASQRILERLKAKNFAYPAEHINYAGASHVVSMPMLVKSLADRMRSQSYGFLSMGGHPRANAHAQTAAFRKTIMYIKRHGSSG